MKEKIKIICLLAALIFGTAMLSSCVFIVEDTGYTVYKSVCTPGEFKTNVRHSLEEHGDYRADVNTPCSFFTNKKISANQQRWTKDEIRAYMINNGLQFEKACEVADIFENSDSCYFAINKNGTIYLLLK